MKACEDNSAEHPVTVEDLQGFWELVYIQVDTALMHACMHACYKNGDSCGTANNFDKLQVADIHNKFSEVDKLKNNNWEPLPLQENQVILLPLPPLFLFANVFI